MKKRLFTLLAFTVFLVSCHKDKTEPSPPYQPIDYTVLPPETQTGANTFGCKVNGEVWVPRVPLLAVTYRDIDATMWEKDNSGAGSIVCNLIDTESELDNWFQITFPPTEFKAKNWCSPELGVYAIFRKNNGQYYRSDLKNLSSNCISISNIDTVKNIVSGIFNFTLFRDSLHLNDKIVITDGRFDLKYYPE